MRLPGYLKNVRRILPVLFWLLLWQIVSLAVSSTLILASPVDVCISLCRLAATTALWRAAGLSFVKIMSGFFLALAAGAALAVFAARFTFVKELLSPLMSVIKSVPVASFVILALFWFGSKNLSTFTSFLIVLPVVYGNLLQGFSAPGKHMLEMARIFRMRAIYRALYIYLPAAKPHIMSACALSLGMCWKAGIAAEVIGLPRGTLGEQLYYAKIYYSMADLFAYTAVIVAVSWLFEKLFVCLLGKVLR